MPSTVRADTYAGLRDNTRGVGVVSRSGAELIGRAAHAYDDQAEFQDELNAVLPSSPILINSHADWDWYERRQYQSLCFSRIPGQLCEDVFMPLLFTCDGLAEFGHSGIIATAVKYRQITANKSVFTGQLYVTFADQEVASMFQSYWRGRKMYTTPHILNAAGQITQYGRCENIECGEAGVVGQRHYSRSTHDRTFTRWGPDVWVFWGPCTNQSVNRNSLGLAPLPVHYMYGGSKVTNTTREF